MQKNEKKLKKNEDTLDKIKSKEKVKLMNKLKKTLKRVKKEDPNIYPLW